MNEYAAPAATPVRKVRYSAKALQKARAELRTLDGWFLQRIALIRWSFVALGVLGLVNALGSYAVMRFLRADPVWTMAVPSVQLAGSLGFATCAFFMREHAGTAMLWAWLLSVVTILIGPVVNPVMLLSIYTYVLPVLQFGSLIMGTRYCIRYQRRRTYLHDVLASAEEERDGDGEDGGVAGRTAS